MILRYPFVCLLGIRPYKFQVGYRLGVIQEISHG